jgi:glycosyltransferase involved in cell wall biosynthesis
MKLIIQIPCFNEEKTLPEVLRDLPREVPGVDVVEYLIIDDGSSDRTVEIARELGVHHVLELGSNRGLATAFSRGIRRCVELGADVIVNTDGDNQYKGGCIADLVAPIVENRADMVVGARPISEISHFSFAKKRLQWLGSFVIRQLSGSSVPDTTSGFRAYSADAALMLHVFNRYTYTLETIIQAGHMNMRIAHVPIQVNPKTRESRLMKSMGGYIFRSVRVMLRAYMIYQPLRTFFMMALFPGFAGLALCARFAYLELTKTGPIGHTQSLIAAAILIILAFMLLVLGILADLMSANRKLIMENLYLLRKNSASGQPRD